MFDKKILRRDFLKTGAKTALSLGALSLFPFPAFGGAENPWEYIPSVRKPSKLVFQTWLYGTAYERILPKFEEEIGIKLETVYSPGGPAQHDGAFRLYGAGDQLDVFKSGITVIAAFDRAQMIRPLNDLPGIEYYVNDFTNLTKESLIIDGQVYGLPYYSEIITGYTNARKLEEMGIDKHPGQPFDSWDEMLEQCLKAKRDGYCEYPIIWPARAGTSQFPGVWYGLTWSFGGQLFDDQGNPLLGPDSPARNALKWLQDTFVKWQISDPVSMEHGYIPAARSFNTGDYLYYGLGVDYWISLCNDPDISPIYGDVYVYRLPGDRVVGSTSPYHMSTATGSPEWAWLLLQYLAGKTREGRYQQAIEWSKQLSLVSGFKSVGNDPEFLEGRLRFFPNKENHDMVMDQYEKATSVVKVVPPLLDPWYSIWLDYMNDEGIKCLRGQQSADETCDKLIQQVYTAKARA